MRRFASVYGWKPCQLIQVLQEERSQLSIRGRNPTLRRPQSHVITERQIYELSLKFSPSGSEKLFRSGFRGRQPRSGAYAVVLEARMG